MLSWTRVALTRPIKESNTGPGGRTVQRDRRRKAYEMGDGTLTVSTIKRRWLTETTHQEDAENIEDFIAKLTYFPSSGTGSMFKATITQQNLRNGVFSSIPRLGSSEGLFGVPGCRTGTNAGVGSFAPGREGVSKRPRRLGKLPPRCKS